MNATPLSFISTFLKLCRCFVGGLKICMWFGHDRQIMFLSFFLTCGLSPFFAILDAKSGYLVSSLLK